MKKLLLLFLIISGIILPAISFAALPDFNGPYVICGRSSIGQADCTLCDVFKMAQKIIDLIIGLIIIVGPIMIAVGGTMILLNGASPDLVNKGKGVIKNVIIGLIIALLAWTVINMIFLALAGGDRVGKIFNAPWNEINCTGGGIKPDETMAKARVCTCGENSVIGSKEYANGTECFNNCSGYCKTTYSAQSGGDKWCCGDKVMQNGCFASPPTGNWCKRPAPSGSNIWTLSGIKPEQKGDATASLVGFINCMYQRGLANLTITSISDDKLCSNPPSCNTATGAGCSHTKNSCHYGGANCAGASSAVDFATNISCKNIKWAAEYCQSNAWVNWEGDHTHVSINNGTCGCAEYGTSTPCP